MGAVYYRSRAEAGQKAATALLAKNGNPASVVSLSTDAVVTAAQIAVMLKCPLHLFMSTEISVPGGIGVGSVDLYGDFRYNSEGGASFGEYYYQEFRSYIDQGKRQAFSDLNRELGAHEVLRKDLLNKRNVFLVVDCLESMALVQSFMESVKSISINKLIVCAPIALSEVLTPMQQQADDYFVEGVVEFFYGADHYFEDNTVISREESIQKISEALAAWPRQ